MILRRAVRFAFCVNVRSVDANAYMNHGYCRQKDRKDREPEGLERKRSRKDLKDREIAKAGKEKKVRKDSREDSYEGGNSK